MRSCPSMFGIQTPPVFPGARIGLLGGSFNPAHAGHRQISQIARRRLDLDVVWWLVSPGNPLKDKRQLEPLHNRMSVARTVAGARWISVTDFETQLGSPFTIDTLQFLSRRYRQAHFVWLMGADNLATLHKWRNWRAITATFPIAVIDRPGWHLRAVSSPAARLLARSRLAPERASDLPMRPPPRLVMLTGPLTPASSTAIRAERRMTPSSQ